MKQLFLLVSYMGRWYAFLSASNHVHIGSHGILYEYEKAEGKILVGSQLLTLNMFDYRMQEQVI